MATVDRVCAIVFALLLVLSMVAPAALAAEPATQVDGQAHDVAPPGGQSNDATAPIGENTSSLELRVEAYQLLENATVRGGPRANDRLQERINDTFEYYAGPNRTTDVRLFNLDTQVISRTKQTAPEVTNRLLASQARLAETTMADANRTVNALEKRNADFNQRRARQQLDAAQRQYQRGEERFKRGQPNAAIAGYRHAFLRSNRLIDRLQRRTNPEVELQSRADPIRNGSGNYTLRGSVFAVRSGQLENLTVTVNDDSRDVPLQSARVPASQVPFETTLELQNKTATVQIEAETRSERGNRIVGSDSETLRLDGDGLSDTVETETTGTDPLDPDSNSSLTERNEADNGIVDGAEDLDGDYLSNVAELEAGLNPLVNDTDGDGLLDGDELRLLPTDPLDEDTDNDGVLDGDEDPDGDGLTNAEEMEAGSHYNLTDGDRDGLTDPEELEIGTDPLLADTDDDGLADASELELGTDPLVKDTDGDGVLDGNETFSTSVSNDSLNASVTFTGRGDVAADASVTNETTVGLRNDLVDPARATEILRIDARDSFETATVDLSYDESAVPTNETDLAVFRLNRTAQFYEPTDSAVDAKNNTVTGRANQTGVYTVLSPSVLDDQFSVDPNEDATHHAETFDEPADCEGECGVNDGSLVVGPLGETSDAKGTAQRSSSSNTDDGFGLMSTFSYPVRTVTTPEDATEMTVSATISGNAAETSSVSFRAGGTTIYSIDSGSVSNRRVSETISVSGGESVELRVSGRSPASMDVDSLSISYDTGDGGGGGGPPVDLCQTVPGDQGRECPDSAVSVYSIPITRSVENVTIRGSGSATVIEDNSEVSVEVGGVEEDVLASKTSDGSLSFSKTYRDLSPSADSNELTLSIETTGLAGARLDGVTIWKDTDGDGFTDKREKIGFNTALYGNIPTDPFDNDTDGDGLADRREVGELVSKEHTEFLRGSSRTVEQELYHVNSHPVKVDSDEDGLDDPVEAGNWTVEVVNRSESMYRWNSTEQLEPGEKRGTVNFTSNPLLTDTDQDGLTDREEKELYHTDPESRVTYGITEEHQEEIVGTLRTIREEHTCVDDHCGVIYWSMRPMGFISDSDSTMNRVDDIEDFRLTDRTDDFDFVVADDYADRPEQWSRFSFQSLDSGTDSQSVVYRTDIWLPNGDESSLTDPWDPDTDNDGLTDGQEMRGLTRIGSPEHYTDPAPFEENVGESLGTEPHLADSDGDGWWDGWIGVYGAGRSDNVILYNEHLHDDDDGDGDTSDDGLEGHEIVQEQIGFHDVTRAPSAGGVDIDGDDIDEHSNVHLGERFLGTDAQDIGDAPNTEITVEVDHYNGADDALLPGTGWGNRLERNYRLYGLNLNVEHHETAVDMGVSSPFGLVDMSRINRYRKDLDTDYYMFVADRAADSPAPGLRPGQTGISSEIASDRLNVEITDMTLVFTDAHQNLNVVPNRLGLTQDEKLRAVTAKTAVHEIGHELSIGRVDDDPALVGFEEVYSGSEDDPTVERVINPRANLPVNEWSVMSSGLDEEQYVGTTKDRYTAFSIEELLTLDLPNN